MEGCAGGCNLRLGSLWGLTGGLDSKVGCVGGVRERFDQERGGGWRVALEVGFKGRVT